MDERIKFIARLLEGEQMARLCREFGISRVTGYNIFNRYKECGLDGLEDRSRRPYRQANKLPFQIERTILGLGGAYPGDIFTPSARIHEPPDEPDYPFHDRTVRVTRCGRIYIGKRKISLSQVFAGQILGLREVKTRFGWSASWIMI